MGAATEQPVPQLTLFARIRTASLFRRKRPAASAWNVIAWWESRRIAYNLIVGCAGIVTCIVIGTLVFAFAILQRALNSNYGSPGLEVIFILIYGIAANIFYTFGWIAELIVRKVWPGESERFATSTFALGLAFSALLTIAPGVAVVAAMIVIGIARLAGAYH
jgi:hypothetical protein